MGEKIKKGLPGSTLKIIAMITMLIDHIGAAILARMLLAVSRNAAGVDWSFVGQWTKNYSELYLTYRVLRMIGRVAFPIFCFLLVEGFLHTSNARKYALRLFGFALLSEIPFDLAFSSSILEFQHQNVFFTLAIGFVTMMVLQKIQEKSYPYPFIGPVLQILAGCTGAVIAELLHTDYGMLGVVVILLFYIFHANRICQIFCGMICFVENITAWFAGPFLLAYNGERGLKMKWGFYLFYPVHLLLLYGICCLMGTNGIPVV